MALRSTGGARGASHFKRAPMKHPPTFVSVWLSVLWIPESDGSTFSHAFCLCLSRYEMQSQGSSHAKFLSELAKWHPTTLKQNKTEKRKPNTKGKAQKIICQRGTNCFAKMNLAKVIRKN